MKNKNYLDYNATSPFSESVISFLGKGDFPFANPASLHSFGQESRKLINSSMEEIYRIFSMSEKNFELVFHSGSTEGINLAFNDLRDGDRFYYCQGDHPATLSLAQALRERGVICETLPIDSNGNLLLEEAIEQINSKSSNGMAYINYLCVHNETGVFWPLKIASALKKATNAIVHVDATQLPGKVYAWEELNHELDGYIFSSHKFGGLKGSGFSFIKKGSPIKALFKGGGQQKSLRGGTENPMAAHCAALALQDLRKVDLKKIENMRDQIESAISERKDIEIIGAKSLAGRAVNTSNFVLESTKADIALIQFDMAGLAVSSGSACSAGSVEPSKVLMEMGLGERARNGIRISLGPRNLEDQEYILKTFRTVMEKL